MLRILFRYAAVAGALGVISTSAQSAEPDPAKSIVPAYIDLVGAHNGIPDPAGAFMVVVRDATGRPLPSVPVTIDFSACPDLAPASVQPYPGLGIDCAQEVVSAMTDGAGVARFVIVGSVLHRSPASTTGCAVVRAGGSGVELGHVSVAVYDQDGVNGVGANDLSLWWCDFFCLLCLQPPHTRSDYDHNGSVTSDINLLTARYMSETSSETGPRCDGQPTTKPTLTATQGGLNLAWSDCVSGGGTNMTSFACASNTGSTPVVFSVVAPPDITGLTGFEAEAIVVGGDAGSPLPDWWRLDGGACRSGSFSISAPGSGACEDAFVGSGLYAARMLYPYNAPYGGRFRIVGYTPANLSSPAALTEGQEYELFRLTINNNKTTGTGACSGCDRPVEIAFPSVKLVQGGGCAEPAAGATIAATLPDVIVDFPATSNHVYWQSLFTGVGGVVAAELGLARSGANPEEGLVLEVTLPSSAFATLDVFDPSGRRVATRALQSLAPGRHRVALATPGEIRPGLYFVRLSQGGRQRRLKATVVE